MEKNYQDRQRNGHYYRESRGNSQGNGGYYGNGQNGGRYYGDGQNDGQYYGNGQNGGGYGRNDVPQGNPGGDDGPGGRKKPKKKKTVGDVLSGLLMLVALGVFLYSGYTLYGFYKDYKTGTDEYDSLAIYAENDKADESENLADYEKEGAAEPETAVVEENGEQKKLPVMSNPVDFAELKQVNEDIVGWLKIRALDISYPIVQGEDNDYYLHRTFEKVDNFAGCIFMNYSNKDDFTDQNTVIYGHNMKNGSMFGTLKKFKEEETYEKSEYFWIFTPDLIYQYHIFSAMTVNKTGMTYQTFFMDDEFQTLIDTAFEKSVVDGSDIKVDTDDRIVTLSTCTGDDSTRFVVMGKLEQIYAVRE